MKTKLFTTLLALGVGSTCQAEVGFHPLFADHAVLQQGRPVKVWGRATTESRVTVTYRNHRVEAPVVDGEWRALLPALSPGSPSELVVEGENRVVAKDVVVGEVWIASGQSNMLFRLGSSTGGNEAVAQAQDADLRFFQLDRKADRPNPYAIASSWRVTSPESVRGLSAVAYYCARDLRRELQVPIGIIQNAWGGSTGEAWINEPVEAAIYEQKLFQRSRGALYKGMVEAISPYTVRGVWWYQGEANRGRPEQYDGIFARLMSDWRGAFDAPELPFLYVQLPVFVGKGRSPEGTVLARFREAQLKLLRYPNTGMVVSIDTGDPLDIHPKVKQPIGERLAQLALAKVYGKANAALCPVPEAFSFEDGVAIVRLLGVKDGLSTSDGLAPQSFSIAGADRVFHAAEARLEGGRIIVKSGRVETPVAVRYAFSDQPLPAPNVVNSAGFPISPFRSDDWSLPRAEAEAAAPTDHDN